MSRHPLLIVALLLFLGAAGFWWRASRAMPLSPPAGPFVVLDADRREVRVYQDVHPGAVFALAPDAVLPAAAGTYAVRERSESRAVPGATSTLPSFVRFARGAYFHASARGLPASVALAPDDARALYALVGTGTPVTVIGKGLLPRQSGEDDTLEAPPWRERLAEALPRADAYLVTSLPDGAELLAKDPDTPRPIASVSKLVTLAVARELAAGDPAMAGRLEKLVPPLLMISSNDAADRIAALFGRAPFIAAMNAFAARIGMTHASFADPSGLSPHNVASPRDLAALLAHLAVHDPDLLALTHEASLGGVPNTNRFIRAHEPWYLAGKTGYIPEAGQTFAAILSFVEPAGATRQFGVVVLKSPERYADVRTVATNLSRAAGEVAALAFPGLKPPAPLPPPPLRLLFVGDIMLDRDVRARVAKQFDGNYHRLFEYAYFIRMADIAFGNLEGPVSDRGYDLGNLYSFRMDPAVLSVLAETGFDALSLANNHVGDWGRSAFADTIVRVGSAGLVGAGAGDTHDDAARVRVVERRGVKVGFLAFSDVGPGWLAADPAQPSLLLASDPRHDEIIRTASAAVDVLVVSYHFGEEYRTEPTDRQRALAHAAIDAGARIVVGAHPHVVEPIERYRDGVIAYSLGNFIFDQTFSEETMQGGVLEVDITGTSTVTDVRLQTVVLDRDYRPSLREDLSITSSPALPTERESVSAKLLNALHF